jgi:Cyclin, N-terminal domain
MPHLADFVRYMVNISQTLPMTLLTAMVFLERFRRNLPNTSSGTTETLHRIFLAALILANKVLFDVPLKNAHWAKMSSSFYTLEEINLMEKQFLSIIHYDLSLNNEELVRLLHYILNRKRQSVMPSMPHSVPNYAPNLQMPSAGGSRRESLVPVIFRPSMVTCGLQPVWPSPPPDSLIPEGYYNSYRNGNKLDTLMLPSSLIDHSPYSDQAYSSMVHL